MSASCSDSGLRPARWILLTDFLITETVRGAEIEERRKGMWLRITSVSYGPDPGGGTDLMAAVDEQLRAAYRDAERERRAQAGA